MGPPWYVFVCFASNESNCKQAYSVRFGLCLYFTNPTFASRLKTMYQDTSIPRAKERAERVERGAPAPERARAREVPAPPPGRARAALLVVCGIPRSR